MFCPQGKYRKEQGLIYCQASASLLTKISINKNKLKVDEICDDARSYFEGDFEIMNKNGEI